MLPRAGLASRWSAVTDADPAFLGTLVAIVLAGGVLALALLVVQTRLIAMLDALTTDVIAKIKDATLIALALIIYDEEINVVNVVGMFLMVLGTCAFREVRKGALVSHPSGHAYEVAATEEVPDDEEVDADASFTEDDGGRAEEGQPTSSTTSTRGTIELVERKMLPS